jgi:hypothetical protein
VPREPRGPCAKAMTCAPVAVRSVNRPAQAGEGAEFSDAHYCRASTLMGGPGFLDGLYLGGEGGSVAALPAATARMDQPHGLRPPSLSRIACALRPGGGVMMKLAVIAEPLKPSRDLRGCPRCQARASRRNLHRRKACWQPETLALTTADSRAHVRISRGSPENGVDRRLLGGAEEI